MPARPGALSFLLAFFCDGLSVPVENRKRNQRRIAEPRSKLRPPERRPKRQWISCTASTASHDATRPTRVHAIDSSGCSRTHTTACNETRAITLVAELGQQYASLVAGGGRHVRRGHLTNAHEIYTTRGSRPRVGEAFTTRRCWQCRTCRRARALRHPQVPRYSTRPCSGECRQARG